MKVLKAILKTVITLAVLGAVAFFGYRYYQQQQAAKTVTATVAYTPVTIGTGSLTKSVTGTGSLTISQTHNVTADFPVIITEALVREGQLVKAGDPIARVSQSALQTTLTTMQTELDTLDSSIASLANAYEDAVYIKPSVYGRVKLTYAKAGDMTKDVIDQYGGLMVLSCDYKMNVVIPAGDLTLDQKVLVYDSKGKLTGTVASIADGMATVIFADTRTLVDETVTVFVDEEEVGSGKAQINMPLVVSTAVDGYISKAYYDVNDLVNKKTRLYYVTNIPADAEYNAYNQQREEKLAAIAAARQAMIDGYLYAGADGIVSYVEPASTTELVAGYVLATIYVGDAKQMVISVDELDIVNVQVGQTASIAMDAVTDRTYEATVSYISQIGTPSSGVTTYAVTLDVAGDDKLKIGMNGTATVVVEERNDVVLVPLTALSTGRNGSYVWLQSDAAPEGMPGVQTFIKTGLSSEDYAEVTSGLKEGDVVLITRTASGGSSSSGSGMNFSNFGGGSMQMPNGGGMQVPGTNNRNNNNTNRNRN